MLQISLFVQCLYMNREKLMFPYIEREPRGSWTLELLVAPKTVAKGFSLLAGSHTKNPKGDKSVNQISQILLRTLNFFTLCRDMYAHSCNKSFCVHFPSHNNVPREANPSEPRIFRHIVCLIFVTPT